MDSLLGPIGIAPGFLGPVLGLYHCLEVGVALLNKWVLFQRGPMVIVEVRERVIQVLLIRHWKDCLGFYVVLGLVHLGTCVLRL